MGGEGETSLLLSPPSCILLLLSLAPLSLPSQSPQPKMPSLSQLLMPLPVPLPPSLPSPSQPLTLSLVSMPPSTTFTSAASITKAGVFTTTGTFTTAAAFSPTPRTPSQQGWDLYRTCQKYHHKMFYHCWFFNCFV
jgi:hypothetical protein